MENPRQLILLLSMLGYQGSRATGMEQEKAYTDVCSATFGAHTDIKVKLCIFNVSMGL